MKKKFTEIYNLLINEVVDTYSNVEFRDRVVGSSTPSKDNINTTLLSDVQTAAKNAGVEVSVTTAVSGHRKGTRHESGNAVDIAMINGKGWSSKRAAKKNGVYDAIVSFVSALEDMGYKKNTGEKNNPKVVLTFGFPNHHHHVHVSNTSKSSGTITSSKQTQTDVELPSPDDEEVDKIGVDDEESIIKTDDSPTIDIFGGKMDPLLKAFNTAFKGASGAVLSTTEPKNYKNNDEVKSTQSLINKESSDEISKLPKNIKNLITQLKNSYGITITDEHIRKELEQEGNYKEDSGGVDSKANSQINKLINDAKNKFPKLANTKGIISGYRSYSDQVKNFGSKAKNRGIDNTQKSNTIPGFSQHHTGKAFDIFSVETSWWNNNSDVRDWVSKNTTKYGFDVTYKKQGPLRISEPWHLYYIGGEVNEQIIVKDKIVKEEIERIKQLMK